MAIRSGVTQAERLLSALKRHSLTKMQALQECSVLNVGARILELRRAGHNIETEMIAVRGKYGESKVARYRLKKAKKK